MFLLRKSPHYKVGSYQKVINGIKTLRFLGPLCCTPETKNLRLGKTHHHQSSSCMACKSSRSWDPSSTSKLPLKRVPSPEVDFGVEKEANDPPKCRVFKLRNAGKISRKNNFYESFFSKSFFKQSSNICLSCFFRISSQISRRKTRKIFTFLNPRPVPVPSPGQLAGDRSQNHRHTYCWMATPEISAKITSWGNPVVYGVSQYFLRFLSTSPGGWEWDFFQPSSQYQRAVPTPREAAKRLPPTFLKVVGRSKSKEVLPSAFFFFGFFNWEKSWDKNIGKVKQTCDYCPLFTGSKQTFSKFFDNRKMCYMICCLGVAPAQ